MTAPSEMKSSKNKISNDILAWLMSGLFGVLLGVFLTWGYQLETKDSVNLSDTGSLGIMISLFVVFCLDSRFVWKNYRAKLKVKPLVSVNELPKTEFIKTHLILALLNLPVLLAVYPGFFVYDAQEELNEVLTRTFTTHHPLLHVLLLGGTIALVHKITLSWNAGIFVYIFLQMLVITGIFAYVITYMRKRGVGIRYKVLSILYYGLAPTIVMYSICSCKDGLFSALLLLLITHLTDMVHDLDGFMGSRAKVTGFILTAVLVPCFRHNGFYAYLVFVPFAIAFFWKKRSKKLIAMLILPLFIYMAFSKILSVALTDGSKDNQEILTVPIMQMARVYNTDKDAMSDEEISALESYIPVENLNKYTPRVSDLVKVGFNNELYSNNKGDFWRLWLSLFKKKPATYLNAWLLTSYGYWYPPANINVYKGTTVFTFTYDKSSYFGYETELPGERHSFIPPIDDLYRYLSIGSFHDDAQVLYLLFAPAIYLFLYLFIFAYRLSNREIAGVFPFLPMILVWLTVLLGPTYLVRYVLILWLCIPLLRVTNAGSKAV